MKILAVILSMAFAGHQQDLTGDWEGTLNVQGTSLRIVFHVSKTENQYEATMDSPDQNVKGIPMTDVRFSDSTVRFESLPIGAVYEGKLDGKRITGTWKQSGQNFDLMLLKTENIQNE